MSDIERACSYLAIPTDYSILLEGLRWAEGGDALIYEDGTSLAVSEQIQLLMEGVLAGPSVPPFAYVAALFDSMVRVKSPSNGCDSLRKAYSHLRGTPGVVRNAGLLIAELCKEMPGISPVPAIGDIRLAISRRKLFGDVTRLYPTVEPPCPADAFFDAARKLLLNYNDATIGHWLKHGCGPIHAGKQIAEQLDSLPKRVTKLLELARQSSRLVGAVSLVSALDAAFTLPPRRRSHAEIPQGGYADVSTRGDPDRLLLSQLALDPDDFVRRFAERELLFFEREEPKTVQAPERFIVFDQGVRTWGGIRLALAGAALSLIRRDVKRSNAIRLATTSSDRPFDVAKDDVEKIVESLEASDLTVHPGTCLKQLLDSPRNGTAAREFILLTHPRAIYEADVIAAAHARGPQDRLFTLSVESSGYAEFGEWATNGPGTLRSFRVDLAAAENERVENVPRPREPILTTVPWTGDVEPIAFPFRPGLVAEPVLFGFSEDADWLMAASRDGILHALTADGSSPEVVPRPFRGGAVLKKIEAIRGLADGVVVCGRMPASVMTTPPPLPPPEKTYHLVESAEVTPAAEVFVAAYYDRVARQVRLHILGPAEGHAEWYADAELHCVIVRSMAGGFRFPGCAIDLFTHARYPCDKDSTFVHRARTAWKRAKSWGSPRELAVRTVPNPAMSGETSVIRQENTIVRLEGIDPPWQSFEPMRDGKPVLANEKLDRAQLAGLVLAFSTYNGTEMKLRLCRGPDGALLNDGEQIRNGTPFALSPRGDRIVYCHGKSTVRIAETVQIGNPIATATRARLHNNPRIDLSIHPFIVTVGAGSVDHRFTIEDGSLRHRLMGPSANQLGTSSSSPQGLVRYDSHRFPETTISFLNWRAVVDRMGQVLLISPDQEVIAFFLIRRSRAAAWTPDGFFWGEHQLIGGRATPDADRKIAATISAAIGE